MKVIDCFIFYNELDMLEFRLNELNDVVDYFVLVECIKTHTNNDKELYFENNKNRFSKFLDKIIHIIVKDNIPQTNSAWDREKYQRFCIDEGIKKLNLNNEDIIIIADLDEIPDTKTVLNLKNNGSQVDAAKLFGLDPKTVDYIRYASEMGVGRMDLDNLKINRIKI